MSKRCRQCGRPLDRGEGDFCGSGCEHQFIRENPGVLDAEGKEDAVRRKGCLIFLLNLIIIAIIYYFISKA